MTTTLRFSNPTIVDFQIKTDLAAGATGGEFTVMEVVGMTDAQVACGMGKIRQGLTYALEELKTFAAYYNLKIQRVDNNGTTTVVDYSTSSDSVSYMDVVQ